MNSTPSNAKSLEQVKQNQNLKRSRTICGLKTFVHYKKIAYVLLEQPWSSLLAKIIHTIIILATLISVFEGIFLIPKNIIDYLTPLFYIDSVIALIFALELIARVLSITAFEGKSKKDLIKPILFVDIMGLIPIFAEIPVGDDGPLSAIVNKKVLNSLKTLLILKLLRYVKGAYIFANGVRKSLSSFVFLVIVIIIANFAFATSIYYVERANPYSQFNEGIPIALWYTIVTMTTVGYGDVVPTTPAAKVITGLIAVFGMLVIALPVVILGYHFQEAFNERE
jgi:voltage-gated potassium channel